MSAAIPQPYDDLDAAPEGGDETVLVARPVVVRRNAGLAALIGAAASAIAIAYLWRASQSGSLLDWALCAVVALIAGLYLSALVDARTPLVVADDLGVRIRLGQQWRGLPWEAVGQIVVQPRRGVVRDGRLVFAPHNLGRALDGLDARGRRQAAWNQKLYGAALAVPIGLTTRVSRTDDDAPALPLAEAVAALARGRTEVVVLAPEVEPVETRPEAKRPEVEPVETRSEVERSEVEPVETTAEGEGISTSSMSGMSSMSAVSATPEEAEAGSLSGPRRFVGNVGTIVSRVAKHRPQRPETQEVTGLPEPFEPVEPAEDSAPAALSPAVPLRETRRGRRSEVTIDAPAEQAEPAHEGRELRRPGRVDLVFEAVEDTRVRPIAQPGQPVEPLVIGDFVPEPAYDPVIGPELAAARTRLGLSVDELADRTRIRPHVIEAIEVDDFAPCGGDFYARGHLRTLARVLGKDVAPLLEHFDARYATAPINARRVFEAELATGMTGSMRRTVGGPNWGLLVGVVLVLVLVWGLVRLFAAEPPEVLQPAPVLNGSAGVGRAYPDTVATGKPVHVALTVSGPRTHVVVRDASQRVVFAGVVRPGHTTTVKAAPPVRVHKARPGTVRVSVDGEQKGTVGRSGHADTRTLRR